MVKLYQRGGIKRTHKIERGRERERKKREIEGDRESDSERK